MNKLHNLTGFQRDILYVAAGMEKPHGLAIKDKIENYYETTINHGQLYPNLDTLAEKGFIDKSKVDERTNSYIVTRRGWHELEARREWENQYVDL